MQTFSTINIRDPFILPHNGKYYLYGTRAAISWNKFAAPGNGFDVYVSEDLNTWSDAHEVFTPSSNFWGKYNFWAPEVHFFNGKFYMFASFKAEDKCRGTAILESDSPLGPFEPLTDGAVTPADWECLDGTLYVENDVPYIVFCHEWLQIGAGTVCAQELSKDLRNSVGEPWVLWSADTPSWRCDMNGKGAFVTDGPFLFRRNNTLCCIWSSFSKNEYVEAIAFSDNGSIFGKWIIGEKLLLDSNGGHGMLFDTFEGEQMFICHSPNKTPEERPKLIPAKQLFDKI